MYFRLAAEHEIKDHKEFGRKTKKVIQNLVDVATSIEASENMLVIEVPQGIVRIFEVQRGDKLVMMIEAGSEDLEAASALLRKVSRIIEIEG